VKANEPGGARDEYSSGAFLDLATIHVFSHPF